MRSWHLPVVPKITNGIQKFSKHSFVLVHQGPWAPCFFTIEAPNFVIPVSINLGTQCFPKQITIYHDLVF